MKCFYIIEITITSILIDQLQCLEPAEKSNEYTKFHQNRFSYFSLMYKQRVIQTDRQTRQNVFEYSQEISLSNTLEFKYKLK